jgi:drug/metabolite transporter (DMT)-like permease
MPRPERPLPTLRHPLVGTLIVVAAAACFGTLGPVSRLAYDGGLTPLAFVAWRAVTATILLAVVVPVAAVARGRPIVPRGVPRREGATLLAAAGAGVVLNLAIFVAFDRITVALALFGFYTYPVLVALAGMALLGDRLDVRRAAALACAMSGMALVVLGQLAGAGGAVVDPLGLALALVAAASQAFFVLVTRHGYRSVPSIHASFIVIAVGAVAFVALALLTGRGADLRLPLEQPDLLGLVVFAGTVAAGLATSLFILGVRLVGPVRAGILSLFEPVTGVILAALVLGEALTPLEVLGGGLVLGAAVILQRAHPIDRPLAPEAVSTSTAG